jgi:hypothetical protein
MKDETKSFLKTYGAPEFEELIFSPGAVVTTQFGNDATFGTYRWHNAIDRAGSQYVYAPFDCYSIFDKDYGSFGNLLFLFPVGGDFEVRIAHMRETDLASVFSELNAKEALVPRGTPIGSPGNLGISYGVTGKHTHVEIVSKDDKSEICDMLLHMKFSGKESDPFDFAEFVMFCENHNINHNDCMELLRTEWKKRGVIEGNGHKCLRKDYHTDDVRTFYNSMECFGF